MLNNYLPYKVYKRLWGDRKVFGLITDPKDQDWIAWQEEYFRFYMENQRGSIGSVVNNAGYEVMSKVNLKGKKVLEIGAGDIKHDKFWKTKPAKYAIVDNLRSMLEKSTSRIKEIGVPYEAEFIGNNEKFKLPFEDNSFDLFISFYNLEHLYPISNFTKEIVRVLNKDNATIVGAVPIEGGLAWGLGRYLTSRRWFRRNTTINPDKIICWEHPNFITDIKSDLDEKFSKIIYSKKWPLSKLPLDMNLIWKFIYKI